MIPYVVRTGDHLQLIAYRFGFDPSAVWNDPKNADLKKARGDGTILCVGDVLYIPKAKPNWLPATVGATNTFAAHRPGIDVKLTLQQDGKVLTGEKCRVHGMAPPNEFTTDGAGILALTVPVTMQMVTVEIERLSVVRTFRVGHLDPVTEPSGARQRLKNLGHGTRDEADLNDPDKLARAVKRFQTDQGMTVTGELDAATLAALEKAHGC